MYEDDKIEINWVKIIVRVVIAFLVLILVVKLISMFMGTRNQKDESTVMEENLKYLDNFAKDYFKGDLLPKNIGESNKISLDNLINRDLIKNIKDNKNDKCDYENSYISVTKLEKEYQIKSFLVCNKVEDYTNSYIKNDTNITIKPTTTTTTTKKPTTTHTTKRTTKVTTTKKITTTKKTTYNVAFNSNGGTNVMTQKIKKNGYANVPEVPSRTGYTFAGWYHHGEKFDFNRPITKDYILVAKWSK